MKRFIAAPSINLFCIYYYYMQRSSPISLLTLFNIKMKNVSVSASNEPEKHGTYSTDIKHNKKKKVL